MATMTVTLTPEQWFAVYNAIGIRQLELGSTGDLTSADHEELNYLDIAETRLVLAWDEATRNAQLDKSDDGQLLHSVYRS